MSNILIIKHGSLGDVIQANGAIQDIKENFPNDKVFCLTTQPYSNFLSESPYLDGVLIDKRKPRWNIFYLLNLKKTLTRFSFEKVFDLQNSSRTRFYRKFFFKNIFWSSSETSLEKGEKLSDFDNDPVLERIENQLKKSGLITKNTRKPNLQWAVKNISSLTNRHFEGKYILIFPFSSSKNKKKNWPYYLDLISYLKKKYGNKFNIASAPGYGEIENAKSLEINLVLKNNEPLNLVELISLINSSSYVISNDTGPAHIAAHLNKKGVALFGEHTSPEKVSIETNNFKAIRSKRLKDLPVSDVIDKISEDLNQI